MVNTVNQVEKNVAASFGYVKKDILMLNDSYTNMQEAITQLAQSYRVLGDEINSLKKELESSKKKSTTKTTKKVAKKASKKDDLTLIEGIGAAIERLLKRNKILNFKDLSKQKVSNLQKILENAGPRFRMHDPTTWPKQAKLATDGKLTELAKLQKELNGGVKPKSTKKAKKSSKKKIKKVVKTETVYE